jgi:folate-binding protein YgfZ
MLFYHNLDSQNKATLWHAQGPDLEDFFQRLSTVNLKTLEAGKGAFGFFLDPSAKILSTFYYQRVAKNEAHIEIDNDSKLFFDFLEKFRFSETFTLLQIKKLKLILLSKDLVNFDLTIIPSNSLAFKRGMLEYGQPCMHLWIDPNDLTEFTKTSKAIEISSQKLLEMRVTECFPASPSEMNSDATPLDLGLSNLIPDFKGCYPGQEVIERIRAKGQPAKQLVRFLSESSMLKAGMNLIEEADPSSVVGKITTVFQTDPQITVGLAIVRRSHTKINLKLNSQEFPSEIIIILGART